MLRSSDVARIHSNICGHLGAIALSLNFIYNVVKDPKFEDVLIDNQISAIDAAFMIRPYLRAELKEMERMLKKNLKVNLQHNLLQLISYFLYHKHTIS